MLRIELRQGGLGIVGDEIAPEQAIGVVVLGLGPVALKFATFEIEQNIELRARGLSADDADHADGHECGALLPFRIRPARDDE